MNEKNESPSISLTAQAAEQLKAIMQNEGKSGWILNFSDVSGHCGGGFGYDLTLRPQPNPQDEIFYSNGIQISIPKLSLKRISGSLIDFENSYNPHLDGLLKTGFKIKNPKEKAPCACGCEKGHQFFE